MMEISGSALSINKLFIINNNNSLIGNFVGLTVHAVQSLGSDSREVIYKTTLIMAAMGFVFGTPALLFHVATGVSAIALGALAGYVALAANGKTHTWSNDFDKETVSIGKVVEDVLVSNGIVESGFFGANYESKSKVENLPLQLNSALPDTTDQVTRDAILAKLRQNPILHVFGDKKDFVFGFNKRHVYEINLGFKKVHVLGPREENYFYLLKDGNQFKDKTNGVEYFSRNEGKEFYKDLFQKFLIKQATEIPGTSFVIQQMGV